MPGIWLRDLTHVPQVVCLICHGSRIHFSVKSSRGSIHYNASLRGARGYAGLRETGGMSMTSISLSEINTPGQFIVVRVEGDDVSAIQLKRLGICENQRIELVQPGNPSIVEVAGSWIGISQSVIERVFVEPVSNVSFRNG